MVFYKSTSLYRVLARRRGEVFDRARRERRFPESTKKYFHYLLL